MMRQLVLFLGSTALAAALSQTATAQEYSSGGVGQRGRGPAILTPVESAGLNPSGASSDQSPFHHRQGTFTPYYAPLSPIPTYTRWRTTCYTPYYCGYCPHRLFGPKPPPYGYDGWGPGPMPNPNCSDLSKLKSYGIYTSVLRDDTIFWRMGGNGLVPYGAPRPPRIGPPDIVDMGNGSSCGSSPVAAPSVAAGPAIMPPAEKPLSPQ